MLRSDFKFVLPENLIASHPGEVRSASRLLCIDRGSDEFCDAGFRDFPDLLRAGDLLVFNDTRVIPARLLGNKESGGRVEVLVERIVSEQEVLAHVRASKTPRPGTRLMLEGSLAVEVSGRLDDLFQLTFPPGRTVMDHLQAYGHVPLPPYIRRQDEAADKERYQTIYARVPGAVAAPTAGLHFDEDIMRQLADRGIDTTFVTLHVGAGTFQPVRAEDLTDHVMHHEYYEVSEEAARQIAETRSKGGRVIAVGTTVVRTLESAGADGIVRASGGETNLFITPGYRFQCIDALLTNFHLPESTLLMLVSAFAGYRKTMSAYRHAISQCYRFYSYGDAMFIHGRAVD